MMRSRQGDCGSAIRAVHWLAWMMSVQVLAGAAGLVAARMDQWEVAGASRPAERMRARREVLPPAGAGAALPPKPAMVWRRQEESAVGVAGACALLPNPEPAVVWRRREESAGGEGVKGEGGHATVRDLDGGADGGALASRHWKPLTPPSLPCSNHAKPTRGGGAGRGGGGGSEVGHRAGWGLVWRGRGWRRRLGEACRGWEEFAEWAERPVGRFCAGERGVLRP